MPDSPTTVDKINLSREIKPSVVGEPGTVDSSLNEAPQGCDLCGDFPIDLRARCHPTAPLRLSMPSESVLEVFCYIPDCNRLVARFGLSDDGAAQLDSKLRDGQRR